MVTKPKRDIEKDQNIDQNKDKKKGKGPICSAYGCVYGTKTTAQYKEEIKTYLKERHGVTLSKATDFQKYDAFASVIKDELLGKQQKTTETYFTEGKKQLYYLSIEFLIGRLLGSNLLNMNLREEWAQVLAEMGLDLNALEKAEPDAGTGNGGLGRLVACFLDSLATLQYPGHGYGIRYKYGLFRQEIHNGEQQEVLDRWLQKGYPWETRKEEEAVYVKFGGTVTSRQEGDHLYYDQHEEQLVKAIPYDIPIVGHKNETVNTLRLWGVESDIHPDYGMKNFHEQDFSVEALSGQLYPDDSTADGRVLRLKQQYFMVSATVQSIIRDYKAHYDDVRRLAEFVVIHLNDTHPTLAIPELMRILMDEEGLGWDQSWHITKNVMAYTNHTILPEALEKWPVDIMQKVLPRIYQIVSEINERFCKELWGIYPYEWDRISEMAIIANDQVHMAHLAIYGCSSVNGVAALHTKILEEETLHNFYLLSPHKFNNKTNGITHRRWLMLSNPKLSDFITELTGTTYWESEPSTLRLLGAFRKDPVALDQLGQIKFENKVRLANYIKERMGVTIDPHSRFDIQVKRIHMYKRQLLNAMHLLYLYRQLKANPNMPMEPVTFIFGGKAAPGYFMAKRVIKFINDLARVVNNDPVCKGKLAIVFVENFNVTKGEYIYPAADVSEQISLASKEASGTGNMKFMMNGAVTLGTWDGANVEIAERVGRNNIVIFGMGPEEVIRHEQNGTNRPWEMYEEDPFFRELIDSMNDGSVFGKADTFTALRNDLVHHDTFMVLKDFKAYMEAHKKVANLYSDCRHWNKMCMMNIAHSGFFSSDRTIRQYAEDIWLIDRVPITKE